MDIVSALMIPEVPSLAVYRAASVLGRLALDSVLGLSIRGKYAEEAPRAIA